MHILFIADPMAGFKTYKDTTYAMMREMAARGWRLSHTLSAELSVQNGQVVAAAAPFAFIGAENAHNHAWFESDPPVQAALSSFDAVIMRTDPPFDLQYLYATQLLTLAAEQGAVVLNSGQAMRDFNEKLAILNFAEFTAPTLITSWYGMNFEHMPELGGRFAYPMLIAGVALACFGLYRLFKRARWL